MQTIMIGTSNPAKLTFFEQLLDVYDVRIIGADALTVPPPEETGVTPIENAMIKAEYYGHFAPVEKFTDHTGNHLAWIWYGISRFEKQMEVMH